MHTFLQSSHLRSSFHHLTAAHLPLYRANSYITSSPNHHKTQDTITKLLSSSTTTSPRTLASLVCTIQKTHPTLRLHAHLTTSAKTCWHSIIHRSHTQPTLQTLQQANDAAYYCLQLLLTRAVLPQWITTITRYTLRNAHWSCWHLVLLAWKQQWTAMLYLQTRHRKGSDELWSFVLDVAQVSHGAENTNILKWLHTNKINLTMKFFRMMNDWPAETVIPFLYNSVTYGGFDIWKIYSIKTYRKTTSEAEIKRVKALIERIIQSALAAPVKHPIERETLMMQVKRISEVLHLAESDRSILAINHKALEEIHPHPTVDSQTYDYAVSKPNFADYFPLDKVHELTWEEYIDYKMQYQLYEKVIRDDEKWHAQVLDFLARCALRFQFKQDVALYFDIAKGCGLSLTSTYNARTLRKILNMYLSSEETRERGRDELKAVAVTRVANQPENSNESCA